MNKNIYCFQFYLLEGRGGNHSSNMSIVTLQCLKMSKIKIFFSFNEHTLYLLFFFIYACRQWCLIALYVEKQLAVPQEERHKKGVPPLAKVDSDWNIPSTKNKHWFESNFASDLNYIHELLLRKLTLLKYMHFKYGKP